MKQQTLIASLVLFLISATSFSQNYIRFSNIPIIEKDLSKVASISSFSANDPVYIYFELHDIQKMQLKESESIMISINFVEGVQPLEQYTMIGTQNNDGVVTGSGVVIPPTDPNQPFNINSIYANSFHMRLLDKMETITAEQKKWKLAVDKFEVQVYDHINRRNVTIDFGVYPENVNRFPQFANKMVPKFELKKSVAFTKELSKDYPFAAMKQKANEKANALKEELYAKLTSKTKAPQEYLENNFNGYEGEINRAEAEKLVKGFFNNTEYKMNKMSYFSSFVNIDKKSNGIPNYKYFYIGFYAKKNDGKCAYGTITIRSDFQGNKYSAWRCDTNKITDCECE